MAYEQIRMDRPLSRFELGLAVFMIAVFFFLAMKRMSMLEAVAESRSLQLTINNLRIGTMVYMSRQLLHGSPNGLVALTQESPVGPVISAPAGYIGALSGVHRQNIKPGQWYFDKDNHELVYYIVNGDYFQFHGKGPKRVRIRLELVYDDRNHNGVYDKGIDRPEGLRVKVLDKLDWQFKEVL